MAACRKGRRCAVARADGDRLPGDERGDLRRPCGDGQRRAVDRQQVVAAAPAAAATTGGVRSIAGLSSSVIATGSVVISP